MVRDLLLFQVSERWIFQCFLHLRLLVSLVRRENQFQLRDCVLGDSRQRDIASRVEGNIGDVHTVRHLGDLQMDHQQIIADRKHGRTWLWSRNERSAVRSQCHGVVVLELILSVAERVDIQKSAIFAVLDKISGPVERGDHRGCAIRSDRQCHRLEFLTLTRTHCDPPLHPSHEQYTHRDVHCLRLQP